MLMLPGEADVAEVVLGGSLQVTARAARRTLVGTCTHALQLNRTH